MQGLVDKLAKERKQHIDSIENMTLLDLKQKNRKSYAPRLRSKEELTDLVKVKKSWRGCGNAGGSGYFMEAPIMKPKMLDPWTAGRV